MTLRIDVVTLFPEAVRAYAGTSVLGRARDRGVWDLRTLDLRDASDEPTRRVDDTPFGGGPGMVLRVEPIVRLVEETSDLARPLIALSPSGRLFNDSVAQELAQLGEFSLLCGRYEGIDQRAVDLVVDEEISLGDFVLAGGELAALCVIEATVRLRPGALGNDDSPREESFFEGLLEYPQYTKPAQFRGLDVPDVLRSGDHERIRRWRRAQALARTLERRPDLVAKRGGLAEEDRRILAEFFGVEPSRENG